MKYEPIQLEQIDDTAAHTKRRRTENTLECALVDTALNPLYRPGSIMFAPDFNCSASVDPRFAAEYYLTATKMRMTTCRCQLSFTLQHKTVVLFFYDRDFSTVAASDLLSISANMERFKRYDALPLALSVDAEDVHQCYLRSLGEECGQILPFPLLSDPTRSIVRSFNMLNPTTCVSKRAVFIIDQSRQIRFSFVLDDDRISHSMDTIMTMLQMVPVR